MMSAQDLPAEALHVCELCTGSFSDSGHGASTFSRARAALEHSHLTAAGAAKGIGLACANCLGQEGSKVVVADIDEEGAKR